MSPNVKHRWVLDVSSILWTIGSFVGSRHKRSHILWGLVTYTVIIHEPVRMSLGTPSFGCWQVRAQQGIWVSGQLKLSAHRTPWPGSVWGTVETRT